MGGQPYMTPTSVPTHLMGAGTLRSDPQTETKYRVVYDSLVTTKAGVDTFETQMELTKPLKQVKYIRLLWATIPNAVATVGTVQPALAATDEYTVIRVNGGSGGSKMSIPSGPNISMESPEKSLTLRNQNTSQVLGSHFIVQNTTWDKALPGFNPDDVTVYQVDADYDSTIYYPIGITEWREINVELYNSRGLQINYGNADADPDANRTATSRIVMCFEVTCAGAA